MTGRNGETANRRDGESEKRRNSESEIDLFLFAVYVTDAGSLGEAD
jgi:hypothetical protein